MTTNHEGATTEQTYIHEVRVYFISQTIISEWLKGYTYENSNFNQKIHFFPIVVNNLHYIPDG